MAIEVKWGFVLTARKGWGEVASSVIGNVRAERDDRGLVDVAGREAFVACVQGRARGVRAPEELREPVAVHDDRRAPPLWRLAQRASSSWRDLTGFRGNRERLRREGNAISREKMI